MAASTCSTVPSGSGSCQTQTQSASGSGSGSADKPSNPVPTTAAKLANTPPAKLANTPTTTTPSDAFPDSSDSLLPVPVAPIPLGSGPRSSAVPYFPPSSSLYDQPNLPVIPNELLQALARHQPKENHTPSQPSPAPARTVDQHHSPDQLSSSAQVRAKLSRIVATVSSSAGNSISNSLSPPSTAALGSCSAPALASNSAHPSSSLAPAPAPDPVSGASPIGGQHYHSLGHLLPDIPLSPINIDDHRFHLNQANLLLQTNPSSLTLDDRHFGRPRNSLHLLSPASALSSPLTTNSSLHTSTSLSELASTLPAPSASFSSTAPNSPPDPLPIPKTVGAGVRQLFSLRSSSSNHASASNQSLKHPLAHASVQSPGPRLSTTPLIDPQLASARQAPDHQGSFVMLPTAPLVNSPHHSHPSSPKLANSLGSNHSSKSPSSPVMSSSLTGKSRPDRNQSDPKASHALEALGQPKAKETIWNRIGFHSGLSSSQSNVAGAGSKKGHLKLQQHQLAPVPADVGPATPPSSSKPAGGSAGQAANPGGRARASFSFDHYIHTHLAGASEKKPLAGPSPASQLRPGRSQTSKEANPPKGRSKFIGADLVSGILSTKPSIALVRSSELDQIPGVSTRKHSLGGAAARQQKPTIVSRTSVDQRPSQWPEPLGTGLKKSVSHSARERGSHLIAPSASRHAGSGASTGSDTLPDEPQPGCGSMAMSVRTDSRPGTNRSVSVEDEVLEDESAEVPWPNRETFTHELTAGHARERYLIAEEADLEASGDERGRQVAGTEEESDGLLGESEREKVARAKLRLHVPSSASADSPHQLGAKTLLGTPMHAPHPVPTTPCAGSPLLAVQAPTPARDRPASHPAPPPTFRLGSGSGGGGMRERMEARRGAGAGLEALVMGERWPSEPVRSGLGEVPHTAPLCAFPVPVAPQAGNLASGNHHHNSHKQVSGDKVAKAKATARSRSMSDSLIRRTRSFIGLSRSHHHHHHHHHLFRMQEPLPAALAAFGGIGNRGRFSTHSSGRPRSGLSGEVVGDSDGGAAGGVGEEDKDGGDGGENADGDDGGEDEDGDEDGDDNFFLDTVEARNALNVKADFTIGITGPKGVGKSTVVLRALVRNNSSNSNSNNKVVGGGKKEGKEGREEDVVVIYKDRDENKITSYVSTVTNSTTGSKKLVQVLEVDQAILTERFMKKKNKKKKKDSNCKKKESGGNGKDDVGKASDGKEGGGKGSENDVDESDGKENGGQEDGGKESDKIVNETKENDKEGLKWPDKLPGLDGVLLCYDAMDPNALDHLRPLLHSFWTRGGMSLIVLACKSDKDEKKNATSPLKAAELVNVYGTGMIQLDGGLEDAGKKMRNSFNWIMKAIKEARGEHRSYSSASTTILGSCYGDEGASRSSSAGRVAAQQTHVERLGHETHRRGSSTASVGKPGGKKPPGAYEGRNETVVEEIALTGERGLMEDELAAQMAAEMVKAELGSVGHEKVVEKEVQETEMGFSTGLTPVLSADDCIGGRVRGGSQDLGEGIVRRSIEERWLAAVGGGRSGEVGGEGGAGKKGRQEKEGLGDGEEEEERLAVGANGKLSGGNGNGSGLRCMSMSNKHAAQKAIVMSQRGCDMDLHMEKEAIIDKFVFATVSGNEPSFVDQFLIVFRRFASPFEVLKALIGRFEYVTDHLDGDPLLTRYAHMKICQVLMRWLESYPGDFVKPSTLAVLKSFNTLMFSATWLVHYGAEIQSMTKAMGSITDEDAGWALPETTDEAAVTTVMESLGRLHRTLTPASARSSTRGDGLDAQLAPTPPSARPHTGSTVNADQTTPTSASSPVVSIDPAPERKPTEQPSSGSFSLKATPSLMADQKGDLKMLTESANQLLSLPEELVALQISRLEWDIFAEMKPRHLIRYVLAPRDPKNPRKALRDPNSPIARSTEYLNHLAVWASSMILVLDKLKSRARMLLKLMKVAYELRDMDDFHSLMGVLAGIEAQPVYRLEATFEVVQQMDLQAYRRYLSLKKLMSSQRSFSAYRLARQAASSQCVPYLGTYLQDITAINEVKDDMRDGKVNLSKFLQISKSAGTVLECGRMAPEIERDERVEGLVVRVPVLSEDVQYELSYKYKLRPQSAYQHHHHHSHLSQLPPPPPQSHPPQQSQQQNQDQEPQDQDQPGSNIATTTTLIGSSASTTSQQVNGAGGKNVTGSIGGVGGGGNVGIGSSGPNNPTTSGGASMVAKKGTRKLKQLISTAINSGNNSNN